MGHCVDPDRFQVPVVMKSGSGLLFIYTAANCPMSNSLETSAMGLNRGLLYGAPNHLCAHGMGPPSLMGWIIDIE